MNCYILTKNKKVLHEIEAVDLMQISTIHKFAKVVLQSSAMEYGLGADFAISSSEYAKEQIYEKYLNNFLVEKQKEDANFAQQLRMPVHKFRKLLMHFSQQLYNKSYGIKELKAENLGTFEEWPFFNDVIMKVMIPAENEYEEQIFSKNKIDLKESMLLLNDAVNGAFKEKCGLKYKYLFIDEFQDTDDVQIDSFLKLQNVIKDTKLFVVAVFSKMGTKGYLPFRKGKDSLTSSVKTYLSEHELVTKLEYDGDEQRMEQLFAEIARQKDIIKYLSKHHKLSSKDMIIAILVRDNWQIHNILEEAKVRGEFIETQVGGDLYQLMPTLDLYKLVIALLNPRDPVNLFNLIDSNYVGIQLDIQGLHGLGTEEQVKKLTDVLNQYFTTVMNTTWEKIIMDTKVQPILMLLRSIYEGCQPWYQYSDTDSEQRFYKANYELVLEKIIKTYSVDYIRVICTTVHKAKGLEYGCVIMPYMGMDIASMKKADLDVYVENEKLAYGIRIGDEPNKKYNSNYDVLQ